MSAIPVLYSFARSGGTLVNQLLGVHPHCFVLSEVNPAASYKPVAEQAVEWLGLVEPSESQAFADEPYARQLAELAQRAGKAGRKLVVRDWVTVNYLPGTAGEETVPSGQLEQEIYLEHAGLEPSPVVVTRRSGAVYRSIKAHFPHLGDLDPASFAQAYLAYAQAMAPHPKVQLEALRAKPAASVPGLLRAFGVDESHADSVLARFHTFRNCTGNTTLKSKSESASAQRILPPERGAASDAQLEREHPAFAQADRLLGYAGA